MAAGEVSRSNRYEGWPGAASADERCSLANSPTDLLLRPSRHADRLGRQVGCGGSGMRNHLSAALGILVTLACAGGAGEAAARSGRRATHWQPHRHVVTAHPGHRHRVDAGRRVQTGRASVYSDKFRGHRMADGTKFHPLSNSAASKTLPLGTTAHVTNLENGRTATVRVRDRGPYRAGRIIDVSPGSADALGIGRNTTAPVAVAPVTRRPGK